MHLNTTEIITGKAGLQKHRYATGGEEFDENGDGLVLE